MYILRYENNYASIINVNDYILNQLQLNFPGTNIMKLFMTLPVLMLNTSLKFRKGSKIGTIDKKVHELQNDIQLSPSLYYVINPKIIMETQTQMKQSSGE